MCIRDRCRSVVFSPWYPPFSSLRHKKWRAPALAGGFGAPFEVQAATQAGPQSFPYRTQGQGGGNVHISRTAVSLPPDAIVYHKICVSQERRALTCLLYTSKGRQAGNVPFHPTGGPPIAPLPEGPLRGFSLLGRENGKLFRCEPNL